MKFIKQALVLSFISCFLVSPISIVHATEDGSGEDTPTPCDVIDCDVTSTSKVVSSKRTGVVYGPFSTLVSNSNGANNDGEALQASYNKTYSNSISSNITVASKTISSSLGFDVTKSYSVEVSYSASLKKGQKGRIEVRAAFNNYSVGIKRWYSGTIGCNYWGSTITGNVLEYSHPDYITTT